LGKKNPPLLVGGNMILFPIDRILSIEYQKVIENFLVFIIINLPVNIPCDAWCVNDEGLSFLRLKKYLQTG